MNIDLILDVLVGALAIFVFVYLFQNSIRVRSKHSMHMHLLGMFCCIVLELAQTSWLNSYVVQGSLLGTVFANYLWTIFNGSVLLFFLFYARGERRTYEMIKPEELNEFGTLLAKGDARLLRFWFGVCTALFGAFFATGTHTSDEYKLLFELLNGTYVGCALATVGILTCGSAIHGEFTYSGMAVECFIGPFLWLIVAVLTMVGQGGLGGVTGAAVVSCYLVFRFPHREGK